MEELREEIKDLKKRIEELENSSSYDTVMKALRENEKEFSELLTEFFQRKQEVYYG